MSGLNYFPFAGLLVIVITLVIKILFLKNRQIVISPGFRKNKKIPLVLLVVLFLIWLFEITKPFILESLQVLPVFLTNLIIHSHILKIAGSLVLFMSLLLWIITLLHFKTSLRFSLNENNSGKLITTGIFAFSRNPFFISLDFYFFGIALIFPNLFFIGYAILTIGSIHFFILKEEKFLLKIYGKEYEKYAGKVARYF